METTDAFIAEERAVASFPRSRSAIQTENRSLMAFEALGGAGGVSRGAYSYPMQWTYLHKFSHICI